MASNNSRPLWSAEVFMETVPDHLKQDPDILRMAEEFRVVWAEYVRLEAVVMDREQQLRDCREFVRKMMMGKGG